jgi:oxygen-dependent protoporphyrinogen oxidase
MRFGHIAEELHRTKDGWRASAKTGEGQRTLSVQHVIISTPAPAAATLVKPLDKQLAELLRGIAYASIAVVHTGLDRSAISHPLDGTGFLAPKNEGAVLTGNLWMSSLFPDRAPAGKTLMTSYLGGSRAPHVIDWSDGRIMDETLRSLRPLLGLKGEPEMVHIDRHKQALPVYHGAYQGRMQAIESELKLLPGLHLEANYTGGVSVRDRLARGQMLASQIMAERKQMSLKQRRMEEMEILAKKQSAH